MRLTRLLVLFALTPVLARADVFNTYGYGPGPPRWAGR